MKIRKDGPAAPPPAASSAAAKPTMQPTAAPPAPVTGTAPRSTTAFSAPQPPPAHDIEGTKTKGYVAPNKVESPFSPQEQAALAKKIPCPALAGMFQAGMLKTDKDGTVKIPDLERALGQLGTSSLVTKVLTGGADKSDDLKDGKFNLFKLNGSNLDHTGSTGIRSNGVHPERFEKLASFSRDGKTLTPKDMADANEAFAKEDPGLRGRVTGQTEFAIVMEVFGRTDSNGKKYLTLEDAKSLFVEGQIPASWNPSPVTGNKVGLGEVLGKAALGMFRQLINGQ